MIAILGVSEDDILYFKTKIPLVRTDKILNGIMVYVGTLNKQDCLLCAVGESNYLSLAVTSIIIEKYEPYLIFNIGTVSSFSPQLKQGDLFIPERYYLAGVDYFVKDQTEYGQIPSLPPYFVSDSSLNAKAENTAYALTNRFVQRGFLLSGESFYMDEKPINDLRKAHFVLESNMVAYDTNAAGVALACQLTQTALLTLKVVNYQIGSEEQRLNYLRKGLEAMPTIGKIITKFIIEKQSGE